MRTLSIMAGSIAVLIWLTAPLLAKTSSARPADELATPSSCNAMEPGPAGDWISIPCQEVGQPHPQGKHQSRGAEQSHH